MIDLMTKKATVLVVDDEPFYINVLVELLQDDYQVIVAKNGVQALKRISEHQKPDLILLDWLMPEMNGLEVCTRLKEDPETRDIPVIFLTIKSEVDDEIRGFEAGAVDYIRKPMSPPLVKSRVKTHLQLHLAKDLLADQKLALEELVRERTRELDLTKDVAIYCMASLAETRDSETGHHIRRTQTYVKLLADRLKQHPRFSDALTNDYIELLYKSAPLHDIGKVGVPDNILLHPGPLDDEQWTEMKRHAEYGIEAIERAESEMGTTSFLHTAKDIGYTHHEKWDGSGYPQGLKGDEIPVGGRLMAIADVYDALISRRVYKEAYSHEKAVQIILEGKGTHFDPDVVEAFEALQDKFDQTAQKYSDHLKGTSINS